jgi:hypothetical protein
MRSIGQDRSSYLIVRSMALVIQLLAVVCLTPIKRHGAYPERIVGFVALSLTAWFLNLCSRQMGEHQRRMLAEHLPAHRWRDLAVGILATVFAAMSIVYLQIVPTWPVLAISLSLGGCAGYALTND